MSSESFLVFPPFRLDLANECVWHAEERISLRGKTFAVLRCLLEHPGQLVTKETLFKAVWSETYVQGMGLAICIRELRQALGDDAKAPQFIETVHRRGYRFIGKVVSCQQHESGGRSLALNRQSYQRLLVGREAELAQLHAWFKKALNGQRQIVFVTGEPGIGKTTLVEEFLQRVATDEQGEQDERVWVGRGQCIEHYGAGEAYLPVLEALGRLCRKPGHERLIELLGHHAPTWLVQMPTLLSTADLELLQRKVQGATRERMLRELAEALEAVTAERGLVLWLEDVHWSDYSTLDLVSYLARWPEKARLLVIGTYRHADILIGEHPLKAVKQELQLHRQCEELSLALLTEEAVHEYLAQRCGTHTLPAQLVRVVYQRTEGNPLFMVNVVDDLMAQGGREGSTDEWQLAAAIEAGVARVPESIQQLIERHLDRLSLEDQQLLEVASIGGAEISTAALAVGLVAEADEVEERCAKLARRGQFLRPSGMEEWPDGTLTTRYRFLHALYQDVLYERIPEPQRVNLHRRMAERQEQAYGAQARQIAAKLALHFECGRDYPRAVRYLGQAGENAVRRSANVEAIGQLSKGLELLATLLNTSDRAQQELALQIALGGALVATKGYAAPEVEHAYTRARQLCQQIGETPQLFFALGGLWVFYLVRAELVTARELAEQALQYAQRADSPDLLLWSHLFCGNTLYYLGEASAARDHLEQSLARYDSHKHNPTVSAPLSGAVNDPGVSALALLSVTLWHLGHPDQAVKKSEEAVRLAQDLVAQGTSPPFSLALALNFAAELQLFCRGEHAAYDRATELIALSSTQGFALWWAQGTIYRGWALAEQRQGEESIAQIRQGLTAYQATGAELGRSHHLARLAEAYSRVGEPDTGLSVIAEALLVVDQCQERRWEAELHRLQGELLLNDERRMQNAERKPKDKERKTSPIHGSWFMVHRSEEVEACFLKAMEVARRQSAKSLELRAVMSLSRLWHKQGRQAEARQALAEIYSWFTEGFETVDLREARALLDAWS